MFGFGKSERAEKGLRSALGIFLPGRHDVIEEVVNCVPEATSRALEEIMAGGNAYKAGAMLIASYIHRMIENSPAGTRSRMLRALSDGEPENQPQLIKFTTHMVGSLAKLEGGDKPLTPPGTAYEFLDSVADAFTDQDGAKKKIASYFIKAVS